jgi:hypothetical protein
MPNDRSADIDDTERADALYQALTLATEEEQEVVSGLKESISSRLVELVDNRELGDFSDDGSIADYLLREAESKLTDEEVIAYGKSKAANGLSLTAYLLHGLGSNEQIRTEYGF